MNIKKYLILVLIMSFVLLLFTGCRRETYTDISATSAETIESYTHPEALISPQELYSILNEQNLSIIDTRPKKVYQQGHIPSAINFPTLKTLRNPQKPGMFPDSIPLSIQLRELGINSSDRIVVYSESYTHAALWFYLNRYGQNVQILNGGIEQWIAQGYSVDTGRGGKNRAGNIHLTAKQLVNKDAIIGPRKVRDIAVNKEDGIIIDARSALDYSSSKHIRRAININWDQLINEDHSFKTVSELRKIFDKKGVTPNNQIIVYSRNPFESSFVYFVLNRLLDYEDVKLFDSWHYYRAGEFPEERAS